MTDIQLKEIILYSKDKEQLSQYLSYIFEVTPEYIGDDRIVIYIYPCKFLIISEEKSRKKKVDNNTMICFLVPSVRELEELLLKMKFNQYKSNEGSVEIPEKVLGPNESFEKYFDITDPDGRVWRFSARNNE